MMEILQLVLMDMFWSAIPAVGFAMVFNVPKDMLKYCALAGALAHGFRTLLMQQQVPIEWASLAAATLVGFIGLYWSRKHLIPRPVFSVAAVIPMIPGSYAFTTMIAVVALNEQGFSPELLQVFIENGLKTLFILAALSFGLAIPSVLIYRGRPIV
ncbi:threonine/serine exporter family protein [Motilimonas pumila]|uniref:Threonine/serine exporter n=1 Tax=Motilimonas pumila TaxID=2303987 RepID=A0A418YAA6_9GAMM|nr:threonine/serine exporter family protein [Motilimonas pumila]RJG39469.1 threonine/serine exporter [Motilimonas pumila]